MVHPIGCDGVHFDYLYYGSILRPQQCFLSCAEDGAGIGGEKKGG